MSPPGGQGTGARESRGSSPARGQLAAVGMKPAELARMTLIEAAALAAVDAVLGTIAAAMLEALREVLPTLIGFRDPVSPRSHCARHLHPPHNHRRVGRRRVARLANQPPP